jgi:DNA polymerase III delta prime subunit
MAFDYTPMSVADIVYCDDATAQLIADLVTNKVAYPYAGKNGILLYGAWGTGKTTLAELIPDAIETARGGQPDYAVRSEKVKANNNGVELLTSIENTSSLVSVPALYQHIVLDEVDLLTPPAMASLKSLMDNENALWVLVTNNISKINPAVQDRCHLINFNAAPSQRWLPLAHKIMGDYGIAPIADSLLLSVIDNGNGSARRIVNSLCKFANFVREQRGLQKL